MTALFHGTSIDALLSIHRDGRLSMDCANGHAGPPGVCLTEDMEVAWHHARTKSEALDESFFGWFGIDRPSDDRYEAVLEFDGARIESDIIRFDDFGLGEGGIGEEAEVRVLEDLPTGRALVAIHVPEGAIRRFAELVASVAAAGGERADDGFEEAVVELLADPRIAEVPRSGADLTPSP